MAHAQEMKERLEAEVDMVRRLLTQQDLQQKAQPVISQHSQPCVPYSRQCFQQPLQHEAQQQGGEHAAPAAEAVHGTLERSSPAAAAVLPDELKTFGKMLQSDHQDTRALIRGNLFVLVYGRWLVFVIESSVDATQSQLEGIISEPPEP